MKIIVNVIRRSKNQCVLEFSTLIPKPDYLLFDFQKSKKFPVKLTCTLM